MGLMKGGAPIEQQVQETAMSAEQQRELKNGLILVRLRRYWRIFCIAMFVIGSVVTSINAISTGGSIIGSIVLCAIGWGVSYVLVLYIFLYFLAFRVLQVFFYLKDLFGGNKETRL